MIALEGVRVLDISSGPATGLATMVLADFGAEVLGVDRPDEPFLNLPSAPMWRRGKHIITLNLNQPEDRARLEPLLSAADILVANQKLSWLQRVDLDPEGLNERYPGLICCHVSALGINGPCADYPGYEHIAAALSGRMLTFTGTAERPGPAFSALQVGIHATAQSALAGMLAALVQRSHSGLGRVVRTSLLQGMLPYEQGAMFAHQFKDRFAALIPDPSVHEPPLPTLFYHPAQTGDGSWMQFGNLLPHLFDNFLMVTDLLDLLADPDFDHKQLRLPADKQEVFRERMLKRIQERSADEWMADCIANGGVVAGRYQTSQQALKDPDIVANGHVVELEPGHFQLGPLASLTRTPAKIEQLAQPGEALADRWTEAALAEGASTQAPASAEPALPGRAPDPVTDAPLAGIRVVEIATIIAAPLGASFLADLGATVTKVEQVGGDPYRGFNMGIGAARVNAGKRSIALNLKSPEGQSILTKLLQDTDIVIHNYRPGVPEKLGFGYEAVKAFNPDVIYLQSNGYGDRGPGAQRPSTHPIPGASMGGVLFQLGERVPTDLQDMPALRAWCARLMRANEVNPDPNTALVVASSALLGLAARTRHGQGQLIKMDMFGANAYANHDDFLSYPGKAGRSVPGEGLFGLSATYRLYACAQNQWVFLALVTDKDKRRFIDALAEHHPLELEDLNDTVLTALFAEQTAETWEALLALEGVGCVRADRHSAPDFWLDHAQPQANAMTAPQHVADWGDYQRHGANVVVGDNPPELGRPPSAGEHTSDILAELGYTPDEISTLYEQGSVWREDPAAETS